MPIQGDAKQAREHITGIDRDQGKAVTLQKTQPPQLTLWQTFFPSDPRNKDKNAYSNTAELYDAVPKYFSSKKRMAEQRRDGQFLSSLKHNFWHKDKHYLVKITPARVEEKDGTEREYYPAWREELVEEVLKKLACDYLNGVYLNGVAGVQFTLYELRKELKSRGHDIHLHDLIKSLLICRRTNITITSKQDNGSEVFMDSSIFPILVITKRREWEKNPKGTRCYVQFNPLITHSINCLKYRQFDYAIFMAFRRQLARWFHKRLSNNYTQAALMDPYHIRMSTIVRDSALVNAQRIRDQARYIEESLEELVEKNVLLRYSKNVIAANRKKIEDITYVLTPHPLFVSEITTANKRSSKLFKQLAFIPQQDPPTTRASLENRHIPSHFVVTP